MNRRHLFLMAGAAASNGAAASRTIRVAATPNLSLSPLHLAIERGYFREAGLEVVHLPLARSSDAVPVMSKGGLDVAIYAVNPASLNAIARGARIRVVAARDQAMPDCGDIGSLYARKSIASVAQLKGRRVAIGMRGSVVEFSLDTALEKAGLTPDAVETVTLRPLEAAAALKRGEVDAISGPDLSSLKALQTPEFHVLTTLGQTIPGFQYGHILFGRDLLDGPVAVGASFLRAYVRAVREFMAGATPAYMTRYAAEAGMNLETVRTNCRTHVIPGGRVDVPSLERFLAWCRRKGFSDTPVDAAKLIDERFLSLSK